MGQLDYSPVEKPLSGQILPSRHRSPLKQNLSTMNQGTGMHTLRCPLYLLTYYVTVSDLNCPNVNVLSKSWLYRGSYMSAECSCFIEFIKLVEEKR